jgi:hypothetical protein
LSNAASGEIELGVQGARPASASIYQLDSIVRRAPSLQLTADARADMEIEGSRTDLPAGSVTAGAASEGAYSS